MSTSRFPFPSSFREHTTWPFPSQRTVSSSSHSNSTCNSHFPLFQKTTSTTHSTTPLKKRHTAESFSFCLLLFHRLPADLWVAREQVRSWNVIFKQDFCTTLPGLKLDAWRAYSPDMHYPWYLHGTFIDFDVAREEPELSVGSNHLSANGIRQTCHQTYFLHISK